MLKISTSTNSSLTLTASHIVFRLSGKGDHESVYANQLVKGDRLVRLKSMDGVLEFDEVVEIQVVWEEGGSIAPAYAVLYAHRDFRNDDPTVTDHSPRTT